MPHCRFGSSIQRLQRKGFQNYCGLWKKRDPAPIQIGNEWRKQEKIGAQHNLWGNI